MAAKITSTEDRKNGFFHVRVEIGKRMESFESMMDAQKWLRLLKDSSRGEIDQIEVTLREIYISAKTQMAYTTCFAM